MKEGYLSRYFRGIAAKRLSEVETDPARSNQHEFNGVKELAGILGKGTGKIRFRTEFLYLSDQDDQIPVSDEGNLTWYDARANHPTRSEYRLYYSENRALQCASAGDLVIIAPHGENAALVIIAEHGTTVERQLLWLFGLEKLEDSSSDRFSVNMKIRDPAGENNLLARMILERIGIAPEEEDGFFLEDMLARYKGRFPDTRGFSSYARNTLPHIKSNDDPDAALMFWMEREEMLFRMLEKHLLFQELKKIIGRGEEDPEPFVKLIQSALQRRKSRAGYAMENHLEQIFNDHNIHYERAKMTEGRSKPDFIFPDISSYHNEKFPSNKLFMLAVKTTCKDRWRQILAEAARIPVKHLATIESPISIHQTDEMRRNNVKPVIPKSLHELFGKNRQSDILSVRDFIGLLMIR